MASSIEMTPTARRPEPGCVEQLTPSASAAGPLEGGEEGLTLPPQTSLPRPFQTLRLSVRQIEFVFRASRELGEVFRIRGTPEREVVAVTSHPDHVKSLFTKPELTPSVTGESPLRPIVGSTSVLTAVGPRHMRQRKLLLPPFHGEAVERYVEMIESVAAREIDRWPVGTPFALAPRMQAVTLDVIMSGIFGVEGRPAPGTHEHRLRRAIRVVLALSTRPEAQLAELVNRGRDEPVGLLRAVLAYLDRYVYAILAARRDAPRGNDVLSLLLDATTEEGEHLTDEELRNELLTLVLAGHETTANSLAWAFERLLRTPDAYARLREEARSAGADGEFLDATIHETMRSRPVIPIIGRNVTVPWRLGDHAVPAESSVLISILLLHHRPDVYPEPFAFRPERFLATKPGTYTWIPFGGGIRRCLGATLAMAEQRVVLSAIARRTDMVAPEPAPERARHRNVTMIPAEGGRVLVTSKIA